MKDESATEFIDKLPSRIEWIKKLPDELKSADEGYNDYYVWFFNIWSILNYTPELAKLANKAQNIVYAVLLEGKPMYEYYKHPLSYELSDAAKRIRPVACDIYTYVIWLQNPDLFPNVTRLYCERIYNYWIKESCYCR